MTYSDLLDNRSLVKLYNHKLETDSVGKRCLDLPGVSTISARHPIQDYFKAVEKISESQDFQDGGDRF